MKRENKRSRVPRSLTAIAMGIVPLVTVAVIVTVAVLAVASGGSSGGDATISSGGITKVPGPGQSPAIAVPLASQKRDELRAVSSEAPPQEGPNAPHREAYWYSRYNLGHLVMRSGMGLQLMPPKEKVRQMVEMAGISEPPANAYLVEAFFASGDPHLIQPFNGDDNDFANFRWDPSRMDRTVTPQAMGYTMIKEVIWAKSFASDVEGPNPMNHFRALVLSAEAAAQAKFAFTNLMSAEGLFVGGWRDGEVTDPTVNALDQLVMLWALSELADYTTGDYGWYAAPLTHERARAMADGLLTAIDERLEADPDFLTGLPRRDLGVSLSALSAYADYAPEGAGRTLAIEQLIPQLAATLLGAMNGEARLPSGDGYTQVATQATAIHGLVFAHKITGDESYRQSALRLWEYMETLWDESAGLYIPSPGDTAYTYTTRDVGDVVGAFNALLNGLGVDVEHRFAEFFRTAVDHSGLQIAEGAPTGGDKDDDAVPAPGDAGGPYGQAPVLATEAVYDRASGTWEVTDSRFTTAYAMLADNHFMWISEWAGRPAVRGHGIPQGTLARDIDLGEHGEGETVTP